MKRKLGIALFFAAVAVFLCVGLAISVLQVPWGMLKFAEYARTQESISTPAVRQTPTPLSGIPTQTPIRVTPGPTPAISPTPILKGSSLSREHDVRYMRVKRLFSQKDDTEFILRGDDLLNPYRVPQGIDLLESFEASSPKCQEEFIGYMQDNYDASDKFAILYVENKLGKNVLSIFSIVELSPGDFQVRTGSVYCQ